MRTPCCEDNIACNPRDQSNFYSLQSGLEAYVLRTMNHTEVSASVRYRNSWGATVEQLVSECLLLNKSSTLLAFSEFLHI